MFLYEALSYRYLIKNFFCYLFCFFFLRWVFSLYLWLSWKSFCGPGKFTKDLPASAQC